MNEEYTTKSQGIGKSYFLENMEKIYRTDSVPIVNKKTCSCVHPPKNFDRLLRDLDTGLYDEIKARRLENADTQEMLMRNQTNLTPEERRKQSEERMQAVMKDIRD